jgi:hypothetical protein
MLDSHARLKRASVNDGARSPTNNHTHAHSSHTLRRPRSSVSSLSTSLHTCVICSSRHSPHLCARVGVDSCQLKKSWLALW